MNPTVRTFRAATADDAIAQVRREMGLDAVVIEVKQVASRGMFAWLSSRQEFEVKAARGTSSKSTQAQASSNKSRSTVASNTGTIAEAASKASATQTSLPDSSAVQTSPTKPAALELPNPESSVKRVVTESPTTTFADRTTDDLASLQSGLNLRSRIGTRIADPSDSPAIPSVSSSIRPAAGSRSLDLIGNAIPVRSSIGMTSPETALTIEQRLDSLQQMIAELGRRTQPRGLIEIPPELFPHYLTLVEADVEDTIAREMVMKLQRHALPGQLNDVASTMALMTALIEQQIPCGSALSLQSGRRKIAMVVGPTGVGKTTTLAKLAGCHGIQDGLKLGLITVDTYRVAAVEQLRTYAEIIDLPMRVVKSPQEIQEALDSFADRDLVLIDTAGRSPQDDRKLDELRKLIDVACPDDVYLVLSLASGATALRTAAERFAAARPSSLIITKLDEAAGCGGLLGVSRDIGLPISYFTTGQEVPSDIEPANPCRAARLILGTDHVSRKPASLESARPVRV